MAARHYLETAVLLASLCKGNPHREHLSVIGFGVHHAIVLVPSRCGVLAGSFFSGDQMLGKLDSYMLDWIRIDLGSDDRLNKV
jgi:hypothetical protein